MYIVVTGASGFIGPTLIRELARQGHSGVATSRRPISDLPAGWEWSERTLVLTQSLRMPGPDWLVHLEVKQHVSNPTADDCEEFERVNVGCTQQWLEWCERHKVHRFVFLSTIKAVGGANGCQSEESKQIPLSKYGRSKRAAEDRVREWGTSVSQRTALILRPAVVYGPGSGANIYSLVEAIASNRFFLIGRGDNIKSLVSVSNVAAAIAFLIREDKPGSHVFNVVDRESYSVRDTAKIIARELGRGRPLRSLPRWLATVGAALGDMAAYVGLEFPLTSPRLNALLEPTHFSCGKLVAAGFVHPQSTAIALAEMVRWYKSHRDQ